MKTPLWDIDPFPTLIFDPDTDRATRLSVGLVEGGVPVEIVASAETMLETVRKKYFRTLIVSVDLDDANCLAFLDALRLAVPTGWIIAIGSRADAESHAVAYRHGVDSLLAAPASPPELLHRIGSLQLRSRPRL
jgi:DNA-binding response OmpR family regulator